MFISPNEDNTAVHGCHCLGDMILCMHKVLAIPQSWYFNAEIGIVFDNFVPGFWFWLQPCSSFLTFSVIQNTKKTVNTTIISGMLIE